MPVSEPQIRGNTGVCEAACAGPPISPAYTMSEQRSMQRSLRVGKPVPVALCALGYVKRRPGKSASRRGGVSAAERRVCVQCDDLEPLSSFAPSEIRNHVNTLGPLHGMQAGFREPRAPDLTPDSSPGRPCARAPQLIACSLFDTWTRLDQPQPTPPPRHQMVNQMEPPSPASNAPGPITRVQNPAIALARWNELSMSVRRARARLASEAEPAWPREAPPKYPVH